MPSDNEWKQEAIKRDLIWTAKKMGKKYNAIMMMWYKVESLGEDKRLKIQISMIMYSILNMYGVDLDKFSHGIKLFEENREEFMDNAKKAGWVVEIVDKSDIGNSIFGKSKNYVMWGKE